MLQPPSPQPSAGTRPIAPTDIPRPITALLLTGGGARAAYQVGVLQALSQLHRECAEPRNGNPFPIMTGTSAGAINAAAMACGADRFDWAVAQLTRVWSHLSTQDVYLADSLSVMRTGARWLTLLSLGWALARWSRMRPRSLLNNTPLAQFLRERIPLERLPTLIEQGHLHALAVTASSYSTGEHVTFFEAGERLNPWVRSQRRAVRDHITHGHLLASAAIPFVFPAIGLQVQGTEEFFGDGSMRQSAPMAAAIHLGAERILVVGSGRMHETRENVSTQHTPVRHLYPTLAQVAGHALSNIFLDALSVDIERLQRINQTVRLIAPENRSNSALRPIELLVINPSQPLDTLAAKHLESLPRSVRSLLGALGVRADIADTRNAALASYLLFENGYIRDLIALGHSDAMALRHSIIQWMGWKNTASILEMPAHYK